MDTTNKQKKYRVYKYASEINISTDAIIDLLKSKGFEIKYHMALMSDEMIDILQSHFKKDIDKSEEHKRKLAKFIEKRAEKTESNKESYDKSVTITNEKDEVETEVIIETVEGKTEKIDIPEINTLKEEDEVKSEVQEVDQNDDVIVEETFTQPIEDKIKDFEIEKAKEIIQELDKSEDEIISIEEDKIENDVFQTDAEKELNGRKKGLTIIGKMDLHEKRRDKKKKEPVVSEK